ncbi:hypothetical protein GCM10010399_17060 [Dactylosporangium fulvum]|uniref:DUF2637 domain-containing protein n=1 Tax=Dactylosporangium fulvum TaxID=53359 RepID=A0ABY5W3U8_9ACTN|nr:DUF2637 domain-containing protein [Dactylosporangium fulvum]UWP82766.1 DUF2637 domain-containing protein [Dactylosporangium fulvum]
MHPKPHGRIWAYIGTLVGGLASLAANIAHCYVPPTDAPAGWSPEVGAVISAMFWPVALFIAVEILARTPWPTGGWWLLARFGGLLPVALVAAVVSYRHLSSLLRHYGEDPLTTVAGPAAVDGLMVMAAAALLASGARRQPKPIEPPAPTSTAPEPMPATEIPVEPLPRAINGAIPSGVVR